jgi:hypothetical protein
VSWAGIGTTVGVLFPSRPRFKLLWKRYEKGPDAYLRLLPTKNLPRPLPLASLNTAAIHAPLLRSSGYGGITTINKHGALIYDPAGAHRGGSAPIHFVTQLFQSGELWCMSDSLIVRERSYRPAYVPIPLIPMLPMEQAFYRTLQTSTTRRRRSRRVMVSASKSCGARRCRCARSRASVRYR